MLISRIGQVFDQLTIDKRTVLYHQISMATFTSSIDQGSKHIEAIFFCATLGILITDEKGKIVAVNPFALNELGYTEKELIGKKIEILVPAPFKKKHSQHHAMYIEKPQTRLMGDGHHLFALRKDGTAFPAEISLSNYTRNGDKYTIAFINNITARKRSEAEIEKLTAALEAKVIERTADLERTTQQLKQSMSKLEEAQSFQKALFDNAGAMIIATDEKGMIKFFNPEAAECIGYAQPEVIDKHSPVLFLDREEIARKRKLLYNEFGVMAEDDFSVLVEKAKRNIHTEEQYTYIRKEKTTFPVVLTITAIRNNDGMITGYMVIAIDITERKKAEENLIKALKKEKELNELKSRFVSMASHEFRTPLSTVLSSAYLIEKYTQSDDQLKREKHLQRIIASVGTLTDILNDFLSVGKIEEGKIQVRPSAFSISNLVSGLSAELENTLKKGQQINYTHEGPEEVIMDMSLLKHIIMNLISNASKFSAEGRRVEIKTKCLSQQVILIVKDHGIGIAKEDQKHLMERFFRGANAGNIQGTGLGLHIVSKYAELMNGTVQCNSELEKGTEFIITFTAKPEHHEKDTAD
jgi:PAS domain S-box-containing protein